MVKYSSYEEATRQRSKRKKKYLLLRVLHMCLLILTMGCAALLLLSYLAAYVNPNKISFFQFLALGMPLLIMANMILMLIWILRWKFHALIPFLALLVGAGNIGLFYRPVLSKQHDAERSDGEFVMVSYNVMGFINKDGNGKDVSSINRVCDFINGYDPDIFCMQEYQTNGSLLRQSDVDSKLEQLGYSRISYRMKWNAGGWGIAIYSRYPIINSEALLYEESTNSSMWVDLVINKDTVRVFNNHLQTTAISASDKEFMRHDMVGGDTEEVSSRMKTIYSKMADNFRRRAIQADTISQIIHNSPYPTIVCGDFNDTPASYTYHKMRGNFKDAYVERGQGRGYSYRGIMNLFRIDYVMHSDDIQSTYYVSPSSPLSDHNPVVTKLRINRKNTK